jgi:O-methyltransferase
MGELETPNLTEPSQYIAVMNAASKIAMSPIWELASIVRILKDVPGDIVECGCYKGGTAIVFALNDPSKAVYSFDTFDGMPAPSEFDVHKEGDLKATVEEAIENTKDFPNIFLVRGDICKTIRQFEARAISLLYLDCDLYEPHKIALEHLWPMVSGGGWMVSHDYVTEDCPGVRKAIDEFFGPGKAERRFGYRVVVK